MNFSKVFHLGGLATLMVEYGPAVAARWACSMGIPIEECLSMLRRVVRQRREFESSMNSGSEK